MADGLTVWPSTLDHLRPSTLHSATEHEQLPLAEQCTGESRHAAKDGTKWGGNQLSPNQLPSSFSSSRSEMPTNL